MLHGEAFRKIPGQLTGAFSSNGMEYDILCMDSTVGGLRDKLIPCPKKLVICLTIVNRYVYKKKTFRY